MADKVFSVGLFACGYNQHTSSSKIQMLWRNKGMRRRLIQCCRDKRMFRRFSHDIFFRAFPEAKAGGVFDTAINGSFVM
ncbi:hypothetical protein KCP69_25795 [Salmonella enterica subsp. enterica]|nr:hypothetical protein KCP69_25795 [Salmonella enterica subsp. enterica]